MKDISQVCNACGAPWAAQNNGACVNCNCGQAAPYRPLADFEDPMAALSNLLSSRPHRAWKGRHIYERLGMVGPHLRHAVHTLRCQGVPICSGPQGYWFAQTADEVRQQIEDGRNRAHSILEWVSALERVHAQIAQRGTATEDTP